MFIRSERLFLRPAWAEDMPEVLAAIGDDTVLRNLDRAPWPYRPDLARAVDHHPHFLMTLPGADGARLIGCAGFASWEGETEIGVFTAPTHLRQGYATEAVRSMLSLARTLGHKRVVARAFHDQQGWLRVLEKACFRPTGLVCERFDPARGITAPALVHAHDLALPGNCDGPAGPEDVMRAA